MLFTPPRPKPPPNPPLGRRLAHAFSPRVANLGLLANPPKPLVPKDGFHR